ncbi:triphosphoribosyl-dephospho-CoA synthase [Mesoplasma melaleucae]|uniref:triphosphoribosyl-dephospho-CoA synthase n=2 Tax=Mesoplasma melaleucae TaxID=81459 RepID=A0A2K8NV37_9MOLU|nr:triphosphoribosyl-dephospho-CoA synthase [Mesoplasma melaleucae]
MYNENMNKVINDFLKAIEIEFSFYPSLGLVSKQNSGCHFDMDYKTFQNSLKIFKPFLKTIYKDFNQIKDFYDLKQIGFNFENKMFEETNGVNTHKGLIFHSSIFFYCFLYTQINAGTLQKNIINFCKPLKSIPIKSKSMDLCKEYNLAHPTQIAISGYPVVFKALNYYQSIQHLNLEENLKYFLLLIFLTVNIDDTTMILKIGIQSYNNIKADLNSLAIKIEKNELSFKEIEEINNHFIKERVSPGGAADLFVLVMFLKLINYS